VIAKPGPRRILTQAEVTGVPIAVPLSDRSAALMNDLLRTGSSKSKTSTASAIVDYLLKEFPHEIRQRVVDRSRQRSRHGNLPGELEAALLNVANRVSVDVFVPSVFDSGWAALSLDYSSNIERAVHRAFRIQLQNLVAGRALKLPTRVRWNRTDVRDCAPDRIAEYMWLCRLLDLLIEVLISDARAPKLRACKTCGNFFMVAKRRGSRNRYCTPEHSSSNRVGYMAGVQRRRREAIKRGALTRADRNG
jgi:hypothetical protein